MEAHAHCSLEVQSGRSAQPEPHWPPGLNREQAWAWALDNFPALSRPSCLSPDFRGDPHYCACGLRRHDCPGHADGPASRASRNAGETRKPRSRLLVRAGATVRQEEAKATQRGAQEGLNSQ